MNWFKLECTTRAFVTALQLTVRYEMSVIIIIIIVNNCYAALPRGAAICTALYLSVRPGLTRKQKVVETIQ